VVESTASSGVRWIGRPKCNNSEGRCNSVDSPYPGRSNRKNPSNHDSCGVNSGDGKETTGQRDTLS